jgi:hypothetical protein
VSEKRPIWSWGSPLNALKKIASEIAGDGYPKFTPVTASMRLVPKGPL